MAEDIHLSIDPVTINVRVDVFVHQPPGPAVGLRLTLLQGGKPMPHTLNVNTADETGEVQFTDSFGNATGAPANYGSLAWTFSDAGASLTAELDDAKTNVAGGLVVYDLKPTGVAAPDPGITVSVAPLDANGQPLLEADGVTPFPSVDGDAPIIVNPGAAVGERLVIGPA